MGRYDDLADRLDARAAELARRSIDVMYEDPFWASRFGARGRRFADDDGRRHVEHLTLALRLEQPQPLVQYARWLRTVLTTRGMCTRHIAQNFARLGDAIRALGVAGTELVDEYLAAATAALRDEQPDAGAVQDAVEEIAAAAMRRFRVARAGWATAGGPNVPGSTHHELATLASFVADAVALGRTDQLATHLRWLRAHAAERGRRPEYAQALALALREALDDALPDERARTAARAALDAALESLRAGQEAPTA